MKTCRKCGESFELATGFYSHAQMADGHLNICKSCVRSRVSSHRAVNIEAVREYDRQRGREGHGWSAARQWAERNPLKRKAHHAVSNAIRYGRLDRQPCWCGEKAEAHHPDYSRPLDVVWLCKIHHEQLHASFKFAAPVCGKEPAA